MQVKNYNIRGQHCCHESCQGSQVLSEKHVNLQTCRPDPLPVRGSDFQKLDYRERVNFGEFIGYHVDLETEIKTATTWGEIRYSNTGVHIIPILPK